MLAHKSMRSLVARHVRASRLQLFDPEITPRRRRDLCTKTPRQTGRSWAGRPVCSGWEGDRVFFSIGESDLCNGNCKSADRVNRGYLGEHFRIVRILGLHPL